MLFRSEGYLEQVQGFMTQLQRNCLMQNIDYLSLRTDAAPGLVLAGYLGRRLARS